MDFPHDAHTWTEGRTHSEILERLFPGWVFSYWKDPTTFMWHATIKTAVDKPPIWQWEDVAPNLVLLSALGFLCLQHDFAEGSASKPLLSRWRPRKGEITQERLHEAAFRFTSPDPDPPDADPVEVTSVYLPSRSGGK